MATAIEPFKVKRGATFRRTITFRKKSDNTLINLTGATIEFMVKKSIDDLDGAAVITKTTPQASGIEILTQSGTTLGQAIVTATPSNTDIAPGQYVCDVRITLASGDVDYPLHNHGFYVQQVVNRL